MKFLISSKPILHWYGSNGRYPITVGFFVPNQGLYDLFYHLTEDGKLSPFVTSKDIINYDILHN